jgi:hypothetical protein
LFPNFLDRLPGDRVDPGLGGASAITRIEGTRSPSCPTPAVDWDADRDLQAPGRALHHVANGTAAISQQLIERLTGLAGSDPAPAVGVDRVDRVVGSSRASPGRSQSVNHIRRRQSSGQRRCRGDRPEEEEAATPASRSPAGPEPSPARPPPPHCGVEERQGWQMYHKDLTRRTKTSHGRYARAQPGDDASRDTLIVATASRRASAGHQPGLPIQHPWR